MYKTTSKPYTESKAAIHMLCVDTPHRREGWGEQKGVAVNVAIFDKVKKVLFYTTMRNFNQGILQTYHDDLKESYQFV